MKQFISTLIIFWSLTAQAQTDHLVISQVYGAGGNTGAPYTHDFVELYNPTSGSVSLAGWSLQYAGATTNNWNSNNVPLSGTIAPGKYFLIQFGSVTAISNFPAPDVKSAAITISATSGKIALVNNTTLLTGNCPLPNTAIIDFVGYGTADCAE